MTLNDFILTFYNIKQLYVCSFIKKKCYTFFFYNIKLVREFIYSSILHDSRSILTRVLDIASCSCQNSLSLKCRIEFQLNHQIQKLQYLQKN